MGCQTVTKPDVNPGFKLEAYFSRYSDFSADETIVGDQDLDTNIYFIQMGRVRATHLSTCGKVLWQNELESGAIFGDVSALANSNRRRVISAMTETRLAVFTKEQFFQILRDDPDVAIWMLQDLAHRLAERTVQLSAVGEASGC